MKAQLRRLPLKLPAIASFLFVVVVVACCVCGVVDGEEPHVIIFGRKHVHEFTTWMLQHEVKYDTEEEMKSRFKIWEDNDDFIDAHNTKMNMNYRLGHNQFSDLTFEEYRERNKLGDHGPGVMTPASMDLIRKENMKKRNENWLAEDNNADGDEDDTNKAGWSWSKVQSWFSNMDLKAAAESRRALSSSEERGLVELEEEETSAYNIEKNEIPDSIDWVKEGAAVPVKNQGFCGSCWAFSAIAAIEGAHYINTGELVSLSEQELIDCDKADRGCLGGLMDNAFLFDEMNATGICKEDDYPYRMHKRWIAGCGIENGECEPVAGTGVKTFVDVDSTEQALMEALAVQPVSVAIEADQRSFQFYRSGVYDDASCGDDVDHGVAAVGYGTTEDGIDYFKVRNSWGSMWGDEGYILMSRTSTQQVNGTCGILSFASRPILRDD